MLAICYCSGFYIFNMISSQAVSRRPSSSRSITLPNMQFGKQRSSTLPAAAAQQTTCNGQTMTTQQVRITNNASLISLKLYMYWFLALHLHIWEVGVYWLIIEFLLHSSCDYFIADWFVNQQAPWQRILHITKRIPCIRSRTARAHNERGTLSDPL